MSDIDPQVKSITQKAAEAKKAIASLTGAVLTVIAIVAPNWSDEASVAIGLAGAALTGVATYRVTNAPQVPEWDSADIQA